MNSFFLKKRTLMENSVEQRYFEVELEKLMSTHDWYYEFSDDGSVWRKGRESYNKMLFLIRQTKPEVVKQLWDKYAPVEFACIVD
jgi:hypothetical protein